VKLDFLIPGSANDHFFSNIAFLKKSLTALGGHYAKARVVATLGEWEIPEVPGRWKPYLKGVEIVWSNAEKKPNTSFAAQHLDRFRVMRPEADVAILCDADVCFVRPFDEVLRQVIAADAIAGVMAHYHFPINGDRGDPTEDWRRAALATIGKEIEPRHRYLFGRSPDEPRIHRIEDRPLVPFYINYGLLVGTPARLRQMHERQQQLLPLPAELVEPWFGAQVAVALACGDLNIPTIALPARYNFPNRPEAEELQPGELDKVVMLHYLYPEHFRREDLFADEHSYDEFLSKDLAGVDRAFQQIIRDIGGEAYPFPVPAQSTGSKLGEWPFVGAFGSALRKMIGRTPREGSAPNG
jgi:hypothetical protein